MVKSTSETSLLLEKNESYDGLLLLSGNDCFNVDIKAVKHYTFWSPACLTVESAVNFLLTVDVQSCRVWV